MNKKEVLEIKKQFSPEGCTITRICGCYVDGEKNIKAEVSESFLSLREGEMFKYFDIFKRSLSGAIGKNLLNMDFPPEEEKDGGKQNALLHLRNSKLRDDALISEFYNRIINSYESGGSYYIILIHVLYDVPEKSTDGTKMYDASDNVFDYIMCNICPVYLSGGELNYNTEKGVVESRERDWIIGAPAKGFLFPAFNDRCTDIHGVLYYSKNAEEIQKLFIEDMFGCSTIPLTAKNQKEIFNAVISGTLGADCNYNVVKNIRKNLNDMLEEEKDSAEPLLLTKASVKRLIMDSGAPSENMEKFDQIYKDVAGKDMVFMVSNIADTKKSNINTPDASIKINTGYLSATEIKYINGRQYVKIPVTGNVEVNGIPITSFLE